MAAERVQVRPVPNDPDSWEPSDAAPAPAGQQIDRRIAQALQSDFAPQRPSIVPHVVLADDSEIVRELLGQMLIGRGYHVSAARDGAEAIETLKQEKIDALLLDLQMPGTDGFAVLRYIAEHRRGLPTVLLSGLPTEQIQDRMNTLPDPVLPPLFLKPCDYDQVIEVMDLMLQGELPTHT